MSILGLIGLVVVIWIVGSILFGVAGGLFGLIVTLLVWAIIGWIAGKLIKGAGYGAAQNILLGLVGGIVGGFLFRLVGVNTPDNLIGTLLIGVMRLLGNPNFGK
jgi:uncharacterized membrane protein YeaQ/YmgE (transglycosylase-associated protein family)